MKNNQKRVPKWINKKPNMHQALFPQFRENQDFPWTQAKLWKNAKNNFQKWINKKHSMHQALLLNFVKIKIYPGLKRSSGKMQK